MSTFTQEMLDSMKLVEATRAERLHKELPRFSAEEKDKLLKEFGSVKYFV